MQKEHGNIIKLEHNQFYQHQPNAAVELRITMEAFWYRPQEPDRFLLLQTQAIVQKLVKILKGTYSENVSPRVHKKACLMDEKRSQARLCHL